MKWSKFIPILDWLPRYKKSDVRGDLLAGLTVAVVLVPQGLAYGLLAGLPPIYGLYAGIVPLLLYAFFGTSRQLSVGPVALVSLLILAGVSKFAEPGTDLFISMAITTALIAGLIQFIFGVFRMGFLINFLSHPVILGFTTAAAVIIGLSQLKNLLGIDLPGSNQILVVISSLLENIGQVHLPTFFMGFGGLVLIFLLKKVNKAIPAALITLIAGTLLVWLLDLDRRGVATVGVVAGGLPDLVVPALSWESFNQLFSLAITICLVSFIESLAIAKTIEARHRNYRVVPNQELIALGITKIGGAFFQCYPTTGSFSRSAVNDEAGASTGISSIFAAAMISLTLLFLTPLFYYLPQTLLASIVMVAVIGLIDQNEIIQLWKLDKRDFLTMLVTFTATLTFGIQDGILFGVFLSLGIMVYRTSVPHIAILGRLPGSQRFRNISRFQEAEQEQEILILRFDAQLYFGNSQYFRDTIESIVSARESQLKLLILDASSIHDIDSSGMRALQEVMHFLRERRIELFVAGVIGPVRDILYRTGINEKIGKENQFLAVDDAIVYYHSRHGKEAAGWNSEALQTNEEKMPDKGNKKNKLL